MVDRFQEAVNAFRSANAEDPRRIIVGGEERPRELLQAERLVAWVSRLEPNASEALRLAAQCQHIRRWTTPRSTYPEGREGYLRWRKDLARYHADTAAEILTRVGYDAETIERVRSINQKRALKLDPDVQTMEDALCLSFLEHEADEFAALHEDDEVVEILRKSWRKMSDRGHQEALRLPLSDAVRPLVERALSGD